MDKEKNTGISLQTLVLSSVGAVAAAVVVPMIWERGTLIATAVTPVIVALTSEALRRPAEKIAAVTPRVTRRSATGAAVRAPERFDPLPPDQRDADPAVRAGDPFDLRGRAPVRHHWRVALATGAAAFLVAAAALTVSELVLGGPATKESGRTTIFGGRDSRDPEPTATAEPAEEETPAEADRNANADANADADADAPADRHAGAGTDRHGHPAGDTLAMAKDRIPTSRIARTARVSGLAAGQAARHLGTRAANVTRSDESSRAALERRNLEAAEQIVAALGTMKGAAMKFGQVMSFLDVGLVPEEHREDFQRKLGELRDAAPKVRFSDMRKVMEAELGEPIDDVFAAFDSEPVAAASIGQVYRARLPDGRDVAVKVQYPGVAQAVRADLQNLGMILRLMKRIAPGLDVKSTAEEIRTRIGDELDYELEAQNQRAMARIYRGHPFITVPEVISSLSREKVLVTEWVTGLGFDAIKEFDQATRNRVGEIIFRFFFGCMYRHRQFSGDPHPGNFLLKPDGSVAFLDFGLFKVMPADLIEIELACQRAGHEGDAERLHEIFSRTGFLREPDRFRPDKLLAQFLDATWWYVLDEEIHLRPEIATEVLIEMSDPRSSHFGQMRHETLPADHLFGRRVELLTLAVLSQLGAAGNWHRIAREWMYGEEPVTELGAAEAAFYAS